MTRLTSIRGPTVPRTCCWIVYTESSLRFRIDTVGADRVVFGTDWPYDMALDWPVSWILSMESLTQEEKEAILWRNLERLLNI